MAETKRGYTITVESSQQLLRLVFWGFWDSDTAERMARDFEQKVSRAITPDTPWNILADLSEFPPQSADVQAILAKTMLFAKQHGLHKAARVISSAITKIQIARLSQEQNLPENSFFYTEDEALQWLSGNKR